MGACSSRPEVSSGSPRAADGEAVVVSTPDGSTSSKNQAEKARPPAPYMFQEIIAGEEATAADALQDQAHNGGIFLEGKKKKYWVDAKGRNCFMLLPRGLTILWSGQSEYWLWYTITETSGTEIEVAALQNVCWLDIYGTLKACHLNLGVAYEVVFMVMVKEPAYGWSTAPVNLELEVPGVPVQKHQERMEEKPTGQWLELKVGEVTAHEHMPDIKMSLFEKGGHWKRGLIVKGALIRPRG